MADSGEKAAGPRDVPPDGLDGGPRDGDGEAGDLASHIRAKLGLHLQGVRRMKQLTQDELAELANSTQATISRLESGVRGDLNAYTRVLQSMGAPQPEVVIQGAEEAAARTWAQTMERIGVVALDRLDPEYVCRRLIQLLGDANVLGTIRIFLVDEASMQARPIPGGDQPIPGSDPVNLALDNAVAKAVHTGEKQHDDSEGYNLVLVPIRRGHRVLGVVEIEPGEPSEDIYLRIEAADRLFDELGLLLMLAQDRDRS